MIEKNYDLKEALSRNLTDDFQMHDHDGKYNFYIKMIAISSKLNSINFPSYFFIKNSQKGIDDHEDIE